MTIEAPSNVAPQTITGTHTTTTISEAIVDPFAGVTVADPNAGASETLTIVLSGAGGTLTDGGSFTGLTNLGAGQYRLQGTAQAVTSELDALSFLPKAGQPATQSTTAFTLSDVSSATQTPVTDSATSVIDADPFLDGITASVPGGTPSPTLASLDATSQLIERLYYSLLERPGEASGLTYWDGIYNAASTQKTLTRIARDFLVSSEYTGKYGHQSNSEFVNALYEGALGRPAESAALHHDIHELNNGVTRQALALSVAESPEAIAHLGGKPIGS